MSTISNSTPANANYTDAAGNAVHKDGPAPADGSSDDPPKIEEDGVDAEPDRNSPFLGPDDPRPPSPFLGPDDPGPPSPFLPPDPPAEEPYSD